MYDIFDLLHLSTKEDAYTFCLAEFLNQSELFRQKSAREWGFENNISDYHVYRGTIEIGESKHGKRKKITPDLILYNNKHIAVIESKMYSSEGYMQTIDYRDSKAIILDHIKNRLADEGNNEDSSLNEVNVDFYYFTLAGVPAASSDFYVVKWADYYVKTLADVSFEDKGLDAIGQAIFKRAQEYQDFITGCDNKSYESLVNSDNSWIAPFSLFSGGLFDDIWNLDSSIYNVYNGRVNGQGHSTYRTDIYKRNKQLICGNHPEDNIYLFTRIEWEKDYVNVVINMEYWLVIDGIWKDYIPNKKLPSEMADVAFNNRKTFCTYLEKVIKENNGLRIPAQKSNMLHMLMTTIDTTGKTLGEIINEISLYINKFEEIKDYIADNTRVDGEYLNILVP